MRSQADAPTIVLGADGFLGRHLVATWRARDWPVHPIGRAAGDFTDPDVVDRLLRAAPAAGRIIHAITKQRTGAVQYKLQAELLVDNARIHLNVLDAWRRRQPAAKLISLGSSCVYPESDRPIPETAFRAGPPHPSVEGYALAKEVLITGCKTHGDQHGLRWLHCVLATVYGPGAHTEPTRDHFMAGMIARAYRQKVSGASAFEVWGSPDTVRDLLFVSDQIEAVIAADAVFDNRIVNVTANQPVTIGQCAQAILDALDWPAPIMRPPDSFQGAGYKTLDSTDFLTATRWRPGIGLEAGVRAVLASDYMKATG
jgi:nucleoside-diphosphate-sugar epimerase